MPRFLRPILLFDVDGTLLQPRDPLHTRAFAEALEDLLGSEYTLDLRGTSGMLDRAILAAIYKRDRQQTIPRSLLNRACEIMADSYLRGPFDDSQETTLSGVTSLLAVLQRHDAPMGVVTGNIAGIARKRLERARLDHYFLDGAYGSEAMRRPTLIHRAVQRLGSRLGEVIQRERVIVIGDTPRDIQAARAARVRCLAVASGDFSMEVLRSHRPDFLLQDLTGTSKVISLLGLD